jgi:hypothetical protein
MGHESLPQADRPDSVNDWPAWKQKLYLRTMTAANPMWMRCLAATVSEHRVTESGGKEQTNSRNTKYGR